MSSRWNASSTTASAGIVVTSTGDIPRYLDDGTDALLVAPGDWDAFAARLRSVMIAYAEHRDLGVRGRAAACRHFDYRNGGRQVLHAMGLDR